MSSKVNNTIAGVIHLAKKFNELGDVTIYSLLKDTDYFDMHNQISESAIREALLLHPECINDWIRFSEDKRSSAGWYFRQDGTQYEVGHFSAKTSNTGLMKYSNSAEACAVFIKHEIEDIKSGANSFM